MSAALLAFILLFADGDTELGLARATLRAKNPVRAREYFTQAATKGNVEAMLDLGVMLAQGMGGPKDLPGAAQWFTQAAEKGNVRSMLNLGFQYRTGQGVEPNPAESLRWYRRAAEAGDSTGMYWLADAHYKAKEFPQAMQWFRKSSDAGDSDSTLMVGYMYSHGEGVELDAEKAFAFYLTAARAGNNGAMFNIGEYYKNGKGVAQNGSAARFWYLRAAMSGSEDASEQFAQLAASESADGARLYALAEKTRNSASTNAAFEAAKIKAFPIMMESAEMGYLPAVATIVNAYQYGDGVAKDMAKAREWALISAEMGNDSSQTVLAQYMLEGVGGPRNTQGARFWFEKAALAGNSLAMWKLARIYDGDYGLPPNAALASFWWFEAFKAGSPTAEKVLIDRGLIEKQRDPAARAFVERIDRDGPDFTSVQTFTFDVAQYCTYDGPRCHELSVAARKFQDSHNAGADAANMARLWNMYAPNDADADRKWRERSDCMAKKTESIQKHTYGQQDWYYAGSCY
jgi:TPR repeat protein